MRRSLSAAVALAVLSAAPVLALGSQREVSLDGFGRVLRDGPRTADTGQPPRAAPVAAAASGFAVPRAKCGPGSVAEEGLQGEVGPAAPAFVLNGGYRCNTSLVGKHVGDGAHLQLAWYGTCAYMSTLYSLADPEYAQRQGTVVVDFSDPRNPRQTAVLNTLAISTPHESLKVNQRRGLLAAVQTNGLGQPAGPYFDVYDVKTDCRKPRLLASVPIEGSQGHEGDFTPDGLTYYGSSILNAPDVAITAIDVRNPQRPRKLLSWRSTLEDASAAVHGVQFSEDGRTGYFAAQGGPGNGLALLDLSEVQERKPAPEIRVLGRARWTTSSATQVALPVVIGGRRYAIVPDEFGARQFPEQSCSAGLPPFGYVHIVDTADLRRPKEVAKIALEVNDPANCVTTMTEHAGFTSLTYSSHYCSVDDPRNATALACSWLGSGLRVFDIRDVRRPREIAYYNPMPTQTALRGSTFKALIVPNPKQDVSPSNVRWQRMPDGSARLWFMSQGNGTQIVQLDRRVYPFRDR